MRFLTALAATLVACSPLAMAADPPAAPADAADPEAELDESLKRFGYLAGLARGCVVAEQRVDFEREALDLHGAIGRLFGTDRSFLFASAFGYGTTVSVETKDCEKVVRSYEERVAKFRVGRGGAG
jgi:hypothetical protein